MEIVGQSGERSFQGVGKVRSGGALLTVTGVRRRNRRYRIPLSNYTAKKSLFHVSF